MTTESIVILEGARRTRHSDILENNKDQGLFGRFSTNQLGGPAIEAAVAGRAAA